MPLKVWRVAIRAGQGRVPYRRGSLVQDLLQVNRILCIICGGLKQEDLSMTKVKITDLSPAEVESLLRN